MLWREKYSYILLMGMQIGIPIVRKSMDIPQKAKNRFTILPVIPFFGM